VGLYLLDPLNLVCLLAPPAAGRLVAHPLPFLEATKPRVLYAGVVHEDLLAALVGLYEAVALLLGKPLHRSLAMMPSAPLSFAPSPKKVKPGAFGRSYETLVSLVAPGLVWPDAYPLGRRLKQQRSEGSEKVNFREFLFPDVG